MICISIAQESRRMALVDMHNAARQCDLLEVQLDRFGKAPDISELMAHKPTPIIFSCRRPQDGGNWQGTEAERLALLRQCIISKADHVEIELDVAGEIRPFPPAKRVITYTNRQETPRNLAEIYAQALTKHPDIVKLVTLIRTPEEAWPLVQILAKPAVPTVAVGLGKPGVMLTVLGKKIGSPWTYAALERGMEAYPGQPTVSDLENVYHYRAVGPATRLVGVIGFGDRDFASVAVLNAAFAHLQLPARCLPLALGSVSLFRKVAEAVKLAGVVVDEENRGPILGMAAEQDDDARQVKAADLLLHKDDGWHAYNTLTKAAVTALEGVLRTRWPGEKPLHGRLVLVVGTNPPARLLAQRIKKEGGLLIIASHDRDAARELAQALECRFIQFEALYSTMHDVTVVADDEKELTRGKKVKAELSPGYLRSGMGVMDLTAWPADSAFLGEARKRGCLVVSLRRLFLEQLRRQARKLTGRDVPPEPLERALEAVQPAEE
jgi:3-dehydroquinate dehydratase/shikimate dehydrogenase